VSLACSVLLACLAGAPAARAQLAPVIASAEGIFGQSAFLPNGYGTVLVTLQNRTTHTLHGTAFLADADAMGSRLRHEAPLDLPPRATRVVPCTVCASANGSRYDAGFEVDGTQLGLTSVNTDYSSGASSLVLLLDPPRLRGNVLDVEVDQIDDRTGTGTRTVRV